MSNLMFPGSSPTRPLGTKMKDVQYGILLNVLDKYIPLALCSYSILFKLNRFDDYFCSIFKLWIMFFLFPQKELQQSPLVLAEQYSVLEDKWLQRYL